MKRANVLLALHRQLLESYSRRTTQALRDTLPIPIALPWLEHLLAENVAKEVRKDSQVIARAAAALASGEPLGEMAISALLTESKEIDRRFLAAAGRAPLSILVHYDLIDPIRRRRIDRLLTAISRILAAWQHRGGLRAALRHAYPGAELENLLFDFLDLYAQETQVLGEAVRLPWPLAPLRQRIVNGLRSVMREAARQLAREWAAMALPSRRHSD